MYKCRRYAKRNNIPDLSFEINVKALSFFYNTHVYYTCNGKCLFRA